MIERAPFRRQVVLNTLSTIFGNGWAMVVALVSVPLLLKGLGRDAFGVWVLIQTFSAVTGWFSLADLGLGAATTRAVATRLAADDRDGVGRTVGSGLGLFVMVAIVGAGGFALVGPSVLGLFKIPSVLRGDTGTATRIFAVQIATEMLIEGVEASLEGLQRVDISRIIDAIRRTVIVAATGAVALAGGGLVGVATVGGVAAASATLISLVVLLREVPPGDLQFSWTELHELFAYGRTIAILRPLGVIQRTMDRAIVGFIVGAPGVAVVEVATQVLNGADAVLSATSYAVAPTAAWLDARADRHSLRELLLRGSRYSVLATWMTSAAAIGLAVPFVHVWVGGRYNAAPGLIAVALAGEVVIAPCQVASNLLLGTGRAKIILWSASVALMINLALSTALVATIGTVGTFIGTAVANLVLIPMLLGRALAEVELSRREFIGEVVGRTILPSIAVLLGAAAGWALPVPAPVQLAVGATLAVVGGVWVAGRVALRPGELHALLEPLRRGRRPSPSGPPST